MDLNVNLSEKMANLPRRKFKIGRACEIKVALHIMLAGDLSVEEAEAALRKWLAWAQRCRLESSVKLGRTVRKHPDGILAIFESRGLTNGPSEEINSVVQCAKARARGS